MATRHPTKCALQFATDLRKWFCKNGVKAQVFTNNGDMVSVSWMLKGKTAYKLTVTYICIRIGYIEGQVMINDRATDKLYWALMDALKIAGFRSGLSVETNADGKATREGFNTDYTDDNGNPARYRTDIIKIKTLDNQNKPFDLFCNLFDIIIDFEQLKRIPLDEPVNEATTHVAPKTKMPPPPGSAEWVPLPSRAEPDPDAEIAKLQEQIAKLQEQIANLEAKKKEMMAKAERDNKIAELKAKQAAEMEELMKSLQ